MAAKCLLHRASAALLETQQHTDFTGLRSQQHKEVQDVSTSFCSRSYASVPQQSVLYLLMQFLCWSFCWRHQLLLLFQCELPVWKAHIRQGNESGSLQYDAGTVYVLRFQLEWTSDTEWTGKAPRIMHEFRRQIEAQYCCLLIQKSDVCMWNVDHGASDCLYLVKWWRAGMVLTSQVAWQISGHRSG